MDRSGVIERVGQVEAACADAAADAAAVELALVAARELAGWLEARRGVLVGRLAEQVSFPEATIAKVDKSSVGAANKARQRAATLAATPRLAATLGDGATTAGHVDVVTRAAAQLDAAQRATLMERVDALAAVAAAVCTKHHGKVHHDGWVIELGPNRELTLRLPDGAVHSAGPPHRRTVA